MILENWRKYAEHDCGRMYRPQSNSMDYLVLLEKYCPRCAKKLQLVDFHVFVGRKTWSRKEPFVSKIEIRKDDK